VRLRRPTIVLGSIVVLLGVTLTATSFTWREHVTVQRANGKELANLSVRDYPGATALLNHAKVPKLPMRPTVLEARDDLPETHHRRLHQRLQQQRRHQLHLRRQRGDPHDCAGGRSHAEHWITHSTSWVSCTTSRW